MKKAKNKIYFFVCAKFWELNFIFFVLEMILFFIYILQLVKVYCI